MNMINLPSEYNIDAEIKTNKNSYDFDLFYNPYMQD